MKRIGGRIKELRTKLGLTQEQVGAAIGVSQKAISLLENDPERVPQSDTLSKLARYFQVDAEWLLTGKGQQSPVSSLTAEESELVLLFRAISAAGKDYILVRTRDIYRGEYERTQHETSEKPSSDRPAKREGH